MDKRFRPPLSEYWIGQFRAGREAPYDELDNYDFYVRFYIPKTVAIKRRDPGPEQDDPERLHVVVMFNGLDESLPQHYLLYDRLGASFAYNGIASVLLPTPFHLNRAANDPTHVLPDGVPWMQPPSSRLLESPWRLPLGIDQTLRETGELIRLIRCEFDAPTEGGRDGSDWHPPSEDDKRFYRLFFQDQRLEFSLLGYSLGGLCALSCFRSSPETYRSCIALNSGGTIGDLKLAPPIMDNDTWQKDVVSHLSDKAPPKPPRRWKAEVDAYAACSNRSDIDAVLYGKENVFPEPQFASHLGKIIIVAGGRDTLVEPTAIQRLASAKRGLNVLQIADLGHFIGHDPHFDRWYSRLTTLLVAFFDDVEGDLLSEDVCLSLLAAYDFCCGNELFRALCNERQPDELAPIVAKYLPPKLSDDYTRFLARALLAYSENPRQLATRLHAHRNRNGLLFGMLACDHTVNCQHDYERLNEIIKTRDDLQQQCGAFLVVRGELPGKLVRNVLVDQASKYWAVLDSDDRLSGHIKGLILPALVKVRTRLQQTQPEKFLLGTGPRLLKNRDGLGAALKSART